MRNMEYAVFVAMFAMCTFAGATEVRPVDDIQAILDTGRNVELQRGQIVEVSHPLMFRTSGQRIETVGSESASDYARIVMADGAQGALINAHGIAGATLSKLILDGNRQGFRSDDGQLVEEPMLSFGGAGADRQVIEKCIVMNGRCSGGWGAIHVQEGGKDIVVRENVVFSAGADIRGNGRSAFEKPFGWGDGISTASRNTLIENNLIYDATDEGIMLQGAPGSQVRRNVVAALSREMLGGIALIDPFKYFELDSAKKTFDYQGVVVEDNLILAAGGRIHAGFPIGGAPWNGHFAGTVLIGATIRNNHISGGAGGYGFVVDGVDRFEVSGNTSDAIYSGLGDGWQGMPPDEPQAFMFNPSTIGDSNLQHDFVPMRKSLSGVLRARRTPKDSRNALGYRDQPYPKEEATAVVEMAFVEMLGRRPSDAERSHWMNWLQQTRSNADMIRRNLMTTPEFVSQHGFVDPLELHRWRKERWLRMILQCCSDGPADARTWHTNLMEALYE